MTVKCPVCGREVEVEDDELYGDVYAEHTRNNNHSRRCRASGHQIIPAEGMSVISEKTLEKHRTEAEEMADVRPRKLIRARLPVVKPKPAGRK